MYLVDSTHPEIWIIKNTAQCIFFSLILKKLVTFMKYFNICNNFIKNKKSEDLGYYLVYSWWKRPGPTAQ